MLSLSAFLHCDPQRTWQPELFDSDLADPELADSHRDLDGHFVAHSFVHQGPPYGAHGRNKPFSGSDSSELTME